MCEEKEKETCGEKYGITTDNAPGNTREIALINSEADFSATDVRKAIVDIMLHHAGMLGASLGYKMLGDNLHSIWIEKMVTAKGTYTLLAHRGSGKSTCLGLAMAIIMVLYPEKNIIFLRKTDPDVTEILRLVKKMLENPVMKEMCRILTNQELTIVKSDQMSITTSIYCSNRGAVQLTGQGISGSLTGKHGDIIVTDDIVNIDDRTSAREREKTKTVYQELQNIVNPRGKIINCGTPWHKDDAISLMPNKDIYDCYTTGLMSCRQIEEKKHSMTPSMFAANYELRHVAKDDALFCETPITDFPDEEVCQGFAHLDAAYGGEDYTALTLCNYTHGRMVILGKLYHGHVEKYLHEIIKLCDDYMINPIYMETNGDKGYLAREIKALRNRGECDVEVRCYHETLNKSLKISTYLNKMWKSIAFTKSTTPQYITQIMDWTEEANHDDAPDSAACAARIILKKEGENIM